MTEPAAPPAHEGGGETAGPGTAEVLWPAGDQRA